MADGIIAWFDRRRGFGFISRAGFVSREGGGADVFVHRTELKPAAPAPRKGDRVRFTLQPRPEGLYAIGVHPV